MVKKTQYFFIGLVVVVALFILWLMISIPTIVRQSFSNLFGGE
ncbi:MAG: hypothetical protein R6W84_18425 [Promethearchaeia archaeon]